MLGLRCWFFSLARPSTWREKTLFSTVTHLESFATSRKMSWTVIWWFRASRFELPQLWVTRLHSHFLLSAKAPSFPLFFYRFVLSVVPGLEQDRRPPDAWIWRPSLMDETSCRVLLKSLSLSIVAMGSTSCQSSKFMVPALFEVFQGYQQIKLWQSRAARVETCTLYLGRGFWGFVALASLCKFLKKLPGFIHGVLGCCLWVELLPRASLRDNVNDIVHTVMVKLNRSSYCAYAFAWTC